jgi:hypothetical protein
MRSIAYDLIRTKQGNVHIVSVPYFSGTTTTLLIMLVDFQFYLIYSPQDSVHFLKTCLP